MVEVDRWFQPVGLSNPTERGGSVLRLSGAQAPATKGGAPQSHPQGETASAPALCRAKFQECQPSFEGFPQAPPPRPTGFMALMMDMQVRVDQWRAQIEQVVPADPIFERRALLSRLDALEHLIQPVLPRHFRRAAELRRSLDQSMRPTDETSRCREVIPYSEIPLAEQARPRTGRPRPND
jgi:hypothetical protein